MSCSSNRNATESPLVRFGEVADGPGCATLGTQLGADRSITHQYLAEKHQCLQARGGFSEHLDLPVLRQQLQLVRGCRATLGKSPRNEVGARECHGARTQQSLEEISIGKQRKTV